MKKYLEDLRKELVKQKLTEKEIDEIMADHEEMINTGIDEGLTEDEIKEKFGQPSQLAKELAEDEDQEPAEQEDNDGFELLNSFDVDSATISVNVNLLSEDITYQIGSDSKIKVFYKGNGKVEKYDVSYEKNNFKLLAPKRSGYTFSTRNANGFDFLVELPKNIIIDVLKHVTLSSDSTLLNLEVQQLDINTTSGDLEIDNCKIDKFILHSVSGDAACEDSTFEDVVLSQVSGDFVMEKCTINGDFKGHTVSGDVELKDVSCDNFEMSAVSGDVEGENFYPKKVIFKSISGDLNIKNKEKRYIEIVKKSTLSGDINIS